MIIPTYNSENGIARAISSVLNQSYPVYEIFVVDNGSIDQTIEIVKNFSNQVTLLDCKIRGAGPARNLGISKASGELIAFLDSDDYWRLDKIALQVDAIPKARSERFLIGSYAEYIIHDKVIGHSLRSVDDHSAVEDFIERGRMPALLSTWLFPRNLIDSITPFDPSYLFAQDFELLMRMVKNGVEVVLIREELVSYTFSDTSETYTNYLPQFLTAQYVLHKTKNISYNENLLKFLIKNSNIFSKLFRQGKSSELIRKAIISKSKKQFIKAFIYLGIAIILSPVKFLRKAKDQWCY